MAQNNKEETSTSKPKSEVYNYMWKTYDFTGKTLKEMLDEHPYVKNPQKSVSKS